MSKRFTEAEVLKKLGIPDFRHLTKDKVMEFATILPNMNDEAVKAVVAQFPEFSKVVIEAFKSEANLAEAAIKEVADVDKKQLEIYQQIINILEECLKDGEITPEESRDFIEKLMEISERVERHGQEHRQFILDVLKTVGTVTVAGICVAAVVLGVNVKIPLPSSEK